MIKLSSKVQCPYCGENFIVSCNDYVIDESSYEREIGEEIEYTIECEEYACPVCHRHFIFSGSIWEYPVGCENHNEIIVKPYEDYTDIE